MAQRTRNWTCIGYPESLKIGWLDLLSEKGIQCLVSPLHDKDVYAKDSEEHKKGDLKKAHFHLVFIFDSVKTQQQVQELVNEISLPDCGVLPIAVMNLRSSVRYLIHKDNPEKAQYSLSDLINIGGVDIEKYLSNDKEKEEDLNSKFVEIFNLIQSENISSFTQLTAFLLGFDLELFSVFRKNAFFFTQIMKDRRICEKSFTK